MEIEPIKQTLQRFKELRYYTWLKLVYILLFLSIYHILIGKSVFAQIPPNCEESNCFNDSTPEFKVELTDLNLFINYTGLLKPLKHLVIRSEVSGIVEKLFFEEGNVIEKNAILAHVGTNKKLLLKQLALSNFKLANSEYEIEKRLNEKMISTLSKLNTQLNKQTVNKIRYHLAEIDLEESKVRSSIQGLIMKKMIQLGEAVTIGQELFEIANISKLLAIIDVPKSELIYLHHGKTVFIYFDTKSGIQFEGRVRKISLEANPDTQTFSVEVVVDNHKNMLSPGIKANINVPTFSFKKQILIPFAAVLFEKGLHKVLVKTGDGVVSKQIQIGVKKGEYVQILSGLKKGDQICFIDCSTIASIQ